MIKKEKVVPPKETKKLNDFIPNYDALFQRDNKDSGKRKSKFLSKIFRLNAKPILLSLFVSLFQQLPVLVVPLCTSFVVDEITVIAGLGGIDIMSGDNWLRLGLAVLIATLSILVNVPGTVLRYKIASKVVRKTSAGVRMAMVRKLQTISLTYHKDMQTGRIQSKFLRDMEVFDGYISQLLHNVLLNVLTLVGLIVISVIKNGWVSLFFLVAIPFNVALRQFYRKKLRAVNHDFRKQNENMSARLNEMLEMIPVTKSHGLEQIEIDSVQDRVDSVQASGLRLDKTHAYFGSCSWVVNSLLSLLCLVFCSALAVKGVISVGEVVLYQSMFVSISNGISAIVNVLPQMQAGKEAVNSLSELMNVEEVEANMNRGIIKSIDGEVEFSGVSYRYPNTAPLVVKNFNLKVKKGECIAIVGPSGSGKSTLINMIIGFLPPTEGAIFIDGKSITEYDLPKYRQNISVVSQSNILFSGSIKDNITYGLTHYTDEQVQKVLEMANINEFLKDLPDGVNTNVGEHGDKLSGGQRQRISIARALIRNPRILILDEATSALDNISEFHVQKAIASAVKDRTTFVVAHRLSTIRDADRIIVMDGGECVECGTYSELMAKKGRFFELKNLNDLTSKQAETALN